MSKLALNQQLWNAVVQNDLGMVEAALVAGADPDFRDTSEVDDDRPQSSSARSILHEALFLGRVEATAILLRHGAEQSCDGLYDLSPLHLATLFGFEDLVQMMIEHGGDIHAVDGSGNSLLAMALMTEDPYDRPGQPIVVKLETPDLSMRLLRKLVQAGCDINVANENGETPLWQAVRFQSPKVVEEMIQMGANPHLHTIFDTSLVAEGAEGLNRADALGQMTWRTEEGRTERQRALDILKVLHGHQVALVDTQDPGELELHYPSAKIQREVEGWWQQWTQEAGPVSSGVPTIRTWRR